jgi:hypothetical protein
LATFCKATCSSGSSGRQKHQRRLSAADVSRTYCATVTANTAINEWSASGIFGSLEVDGAIVVRRVIVLEVLAFAPPPAALAALVQ